MADFDEYRTKYIYHCPACNTEITAFRDCGKTSPCRCGANLNLIEVIEGKKIEYDDNNNVTAIHTFKPYFDFTLGKEITSAAEIKEYCKRNNCVYAGDKELTQQCAENKKYNLEKSQREFRQNLTDKLMQI